MANFTVPFVSMETSIYNDIYYKIAHDLSKILNVNKDAKLILYNSMVVGKTDSRDTAKTQTDHNTPLTSSKRRFLVRVTEEFDEASVTGGYINEVEQFPIFEDKDIGVTIAPIYHVVNFTFDFIYRSPSKVEIENMRDHIRLQLARSMHMYVHDVEYTMIIPEFIEDFIIDVHECRNDLEPIDLKKYVDKHSTNRMHCITDMSNKENTLLGVKEHQTDVIGEFDFSAVPPVREDDNSKSQFSLAFSYNVQMEVPKNLTVRFPVMIYNTIMKDKYTDILETQRQQKIARQLIANPHVGTVSTIMHNLPTTRVGTYIDDTIYPFNYPAFDEYVPPNIQGMSCIICLLTTIENKRNLFNLRDLEDTPYALTDFTLDYIKNNRDKVTKYGHGLIFIGLCQDTKHYNNSVLEIDEDLNVYSTVDLDPRFTSHVTINGYNDISAMKRNVIQEAYEDNDLFEMFLVEYLELKQTFTGKSDTDKVLRDNRLTQWLVKKIFQLVQEDNNERLLRLFKIVCTDSMTSNLLGYQLVYGYEDLLLELYKRDICYITRNASVKLFSDDQNTRDKQKVEFFYNTELRNSYLNNRNKASDNQIYGTRDEIRDYLMKTVQINTIMALKEN